MTGADFFISTMSAGAATGLCWYCGQSAMQINYVTLADGRKQERTLPLLFRMLLPLIPNVRGLVDKKFFDREAEQLEAKLVSAGYEGLLSGREFIALRFLMPMVAGPVAILILYSIFHFLPGKFGHALQIRLPIFSILILFVLFLQPTTWLRRTLNARHLSMQRALPYVLDLLTLSVEAGLDFMTAIKRILDYRKMDPLGEELLRMFREVQIGKTRREALRNMAARVQQPDLNGVVHSLVQADELGVSIGYILRIQADQMRVKRFQRAEKLAQEAPVKMLFPLIFFIFPAIFVVLLGPVLLELFRHGI
jgi:tight adherence protein C